MKELFINMFDINFNWYNAIGLNNATWADWAQVGLSLASVIIAFATFCLALRVQRTIASNHAKQKQVEVMSELVEHLNKTRIHFIFKKSENLSFISFFELNIFEIGGLINIRSNERFMNNGAVVVNDDVVQIIEGMESFLYNGFVPKPIADKLKLFYVSSREKVLPPEKCVLIGGMKDEMWRPKCPACKSWKKMKKVALELTKEIERWYERNGIKDCNVRVDYITRSIMEEKMSELHFQQKNKNSVINSKKS